MLLKNGITGCILEFKKRVEAIYKNLFSGIESSSPEIISEIDFSVVEIFTYSPFIPENGSATKNG